MIINNILRIMIILFFAVSFANCKKNHEKNKVPVEQYNPDNSGNYRYMFREEIKKEKEEKIKQGKDKKNVFSQ
jgi:hypothetical protein